MVHYYDDMCPGCYPGYGCKGSLCDNHKVKTMCNCHKTECYECWTNEDTIMEAYDLHVCERAMCNNPDSPIHDWQVTDSGYLQFKEEWIESFDPTPSTCTKCNEVPCLGCEH